MDKKILEILDEIIYVSDIETYELLYLNNAGIKKFGITEYKGMKCYKVLHGLDKPCGFCTNSKISENEWHSFNIINNINKHYYTVKDTVIYYNGRKCKLEIAFNNDKLVNEKNEMYEKVKLEKVIRDIMFAIYMGHKEEDFLVEICEFVSADRGYIFYYNMDDETIFNSWSWNRDKSKPLNKDIVNINEDPAKIWREEFKKTGYVLLENIEKLKEKFPFEYSVLKDQNVESIVVVPMYINDKLYGFIGVDNPIDKESSLEILQSISMLLSINYQKNKYYEDIKNLSERDKLTGARNRNSFINYKEQLKKQELESLGVLFIDINKLKEGNDKFGHEYGDKMIASVSNEIIKIWGDEISFRIGGDEFVVIASNIKEDEFIQNIDKMNDYIQENTIASISLGYIWRNKDINIEEMIAKSDQEMYENKKNYYRHNMLSSRFRHESVSEEKRRIKNELLHALDSGEFYVVYQPKVNNNNGELLGLEALMRSKKGISPEQFIPFYENNKLIYIIDYFMLNNVSKQAKELKYNYKKSIPISVNICEQTLLRDDFLEKFKKEIIDNDIIDRIEIEITERNIPVEDLPRISEVVKRIREYGGFVSLDDFGTGNSNMLLTTLLDISALKIDKSLVKYIHENKKVQIILKSIIDACENMGIEIIAEGVENKEQLKVLKELGNTISQGYYFSKPENIKKIKERYEL